MFDTDHAWSVLDLVQARLVGPLGMRTLDMEYGMLEITCRLRNKGFFALLVTGLTTDIMTIMTKATIQKERTDSIITRDRYEIPQKDFFSFIPISSQILIGTFLLSGMGLVDGILSSSQTDFRQKARRSASPE
jgi:hypothetical protein